MCGEGVAMGRFLAVIGVILVCVICLGLYMQWFTVSTSSGENKTNVEITVDKQKIKEDEEKAKQKANEIKDDIKQKVKEKTEK
jgi:hypothetical protein